MVSLVGTHIGNPPESVTSCFWGWSFLHLKYAKRRRNRLGWKTYSGLMRPSGLSNELKAMPKTHPFRRIGLGFNRRAR